MDNQQMLIKCKCGNKLAIKLIGGQYQYSYQGSCICGREWFLEDLSEDREEE
jgi:hypothetical protein